MSEPAITTTDEFSARALLVGERIDTRPLEKAGRLARHPLAVRTGADGVAVLFREGAVILFNVQPMEEVAFLDGLKPFVRSPFEMETEDARVLIAPDAAEGVAASGAIRLAEARIERLQLIADILAKSVFIDYFERRVAGAFDLVEPVAARIGRASLMTAGAGVRDLLRQTGDVLLMQHKMVGRVEVTEKPELLWDRPELDRLYIRLMEEYELADRDRALNRKLSLIGQTVSTALDIQENNRTLRVEWYIVILIVIEIFLSLYDMFFRG